MKITKEKLKELAAEIIAEDGGELKEIFGLFGDSSTVKSLNGLVQAIAQEEAQINAAEDAADKAVKNYENPEGALGKMEASANRIKKMMETYQSYAKSNNVDLKDWNNHLKHKAAQKARSASSVVRTLMGPRDAVQTSIELATKDLDNTVTGVARSVRAAMKDKDRQSATASKLKDNPMYDDDYLRSTFTSRNPMGENKMKITKANIKQLVAESIRDIFNENVDSPELGSETVAEQLPPNEPLEALSDMKGIAKSVDEALELLLRKRILAALHHGGAKQGTELYELANNTLNALDKLRTAIRDEASKR